MASVGVAVGLAGCATSPAVQAARARDWARLDKALAAEEKSGELDRGEARDVAKAVAIGEIGAAKGDDGEKLVLTLVPCASPLEGALSDRFDKGDDVGASAASVMLSANLVDKDEFASFARKGDPRPLFRALGARSLVESDDLGVRRPLFRDLDERVRLGALTAAIDFASPDDFDAVWEAARLDPLPTARGAAARALGRIGSPRSVTALRDLWTRAEPELREAIADGWGASFDAGGKEALRWAAENETGQGAIAAAVELSRRAPEGSADEAAALGVLTRAIKLGTRTERVFAMTSAPASPDILGALRDAKGDSDAGIAIAANARLYRELAGAERKAAADKLLEIAKSDLAEAARAQSELASIGDARVVPLLSKGLGSKSGFTRALAARAFVSLGQSPKAARILSDRDADIRTQVACAILAQHD